MKHVAQGTLIFPRYHQLDAVRKLVRHARAHGPGRNYLIQHSAGSGKSQLHRLAGPSPGQPARRRTTRRSSTAVVVITDRRVLDQQLQDTIYQFEHKQGVVQKIDQDTHSWPGRSPAACPSSSPPSRSSPSSPRPCAPWRSRGESVAIATAGKRFAVIVDEAHSSQTGETAMELRKIVNQEGHRSRDRRADARPGGWTRDRASRPWRGTAAEQMKRATAAEPELLRLHRHAQVQDPGALRRARRRTDASPFHLYSMRQAIEEGFILDVLQQLHHYKAYSA